MIDPELTVRTAYYQTLLNKVLLNGIVIPVYVNAAAIGEGTPYIAIAEMTINETRLSGCNAWNVTTLFDIVTEYDSDKAKPSEASKIGAALLKLSDNVKQEIKVTRPELGNVPAFEIGDHELAESITLLEDNEARLVFRRLIRIRNTVFA